MTLPVRAPAWKGGGLVVPPEFSGVTTLGSAEQVYGPKSGVMLTASIVMIVGGVFLAIAIVVAIFAAVPAAIAPATLGVFLFPIGMWNVARLRAGARVVVIYPMGFAARVGEAVSVWPWGEITATFTKDRMISGKRSFHHEHRLDVSKASGETVVLLGDHFDDASALAKRIKSKTSAALLSPLQKAYDAGQPVTFGPVTVSKEAIESGNRRLAWGQVANVVVKDGRLVATPRDGRPLKVRTSQIPNVELLGVLIGLNPGTMDLEYY